MALELTTSKSGKRIRIVCPNVLQYANENRQQGFFNDVCIITNDDKCINANRMVLSCHSAFFEKMFKIEMKEKYEGNVDIHNIDGCTMKAVIDYIYTGLIFIDNDNVMKLLAAADYLQLDDIKAFCFDILASNVTENNCFDIMSVSILYHNKTLVDEVYQFISRNLCKISNGQGFKLLSKENLISCIANLNRMLVSEQIVYEAICAWVKHDVDSRRINFLDLLQQLDLQQLSNDYLNRKILGDDLIKESHACLKLVAATVSTGKLNNSSCDKSSKIISICGRQICNDVIEIFSLGEKTLTNYPDLPQRLQYPTSVRFNNFIYCMGGSNASNKVWRMEMKANDFSWVEINSMKHERVMFGAAVFEELVIVAGGYNDLGCMNGAECYVPQLNMWKTIFPLNKARRHHALVANHEGVYALGGQANLSMKSVRSSAERLTSLIGKWEIIQPMNCKRFHLAAVNCNGIIYAIGGMYDTGICSKSIEKYDSNSNKWIHVSDMHWERVAPAACVLQGKIYVAGGKSKNGKVVKDIECYEPCNDTWFIVGKIKNDLCWHNLISL